MSVEEAINKKSSATKMRWVKYVFIDESGDLGTYGSKYFTIAAIVVEEPKIIGRIIKRLRQRKLKKKLKQLPEIKANNSSKQIRKYVLERLNKSDCQIFVVVIDKSKILPYLTKAKDKLYNYLCGILLSKVGSDSKKLVIAIDKKHTNTLVREDFNEYIKTKLEQCFKTLEIEIQHTSSYSKNELQVADFVAWGINRKFNTGDDFYYRIIEEKIINKESMLLWK